MKKLLISMCMILCFTFIFGQSQMTIHTTSGNTTFNLQDITSITFEQSPAVSELIMVQGGTFFNGISEVTVSSFYIGQYEVTQEEYQRIMGSNPSEFTGSPSLPVENISWFDAIKYCDKLSLAEGHTPCYGYGIYGTNMNNWPGDWSTHDENHTLVRCDWDADGYRLPTEAEWEFAAKGGIQTHEYLYSGSSNLTDVAWINSNASYSTHVVGMKAPNELNIYDMSGNVWECVWDIWGVYPMTSQNNPHGPEAGFGRIDRGGGWVNQQPESCLTTSRTYNSPSFRCSYLGFRVCRSAE